MKERLAIIGANESINMLILKAKDMGYETHVFAWKCGDPGEKTADFFYPISIDKKEEILKICKEIGIKGVCSITSDFAAPTVNFIANNLGLVCNDITTNELARNKSLMREAFFKAGLYTPKFCVINKNSKIDELGDMIYPVIVKPIDRWSSKGVTRVNCPSELFGAIDNALSESLGNEAIVEEYMQGNEYSAECICYRGNYKILAFTKKHTTGYPNYIETGHEQPADIPENLISSINYKLYQGLKALGIYNGAAHIEFKLLKDNEIGIIEIGSRMGGDYIGTDLTFLSTGMDYIRMVIDVACGKEPCYDIVQEPMAVEIKFIINQKDYDDYLLELKHNQDNIVKMNIIDCNFSKNVVDSSTRHGYYILKKRILK